jgi:flagellar hook-associated protein 2
MALSSPGIGSGLDVNGLVSQLMALEQRPLIALTRKEAGFQAKLTAFGTVKGALSALQSAAAALSDPARFSAFKATVADTSIFTATAAASATAGSYAIEVQSLATAHKLQSITCAAESTPVGSGTLTIAFGTYADSVNGTGAFTLNPDKATQAITIGAGQNTLAGIRGAINAANVGITASIVNDGAGNRLVISSRDSGVANQLKITVTDDDGTHTDTSGLSQLAYDGSATPAPLTNLTRAQAAQNATLKLDGIAVSKASNTITDAISGVTLNLLKTSAAGATTALTIARDSAGIRSAVEKFVKTYNDAFKALKELTAYNAATRQAAVLQGDATVRAIESELRGVLNRALSTAGGGVTSLSDIGVSFQKDGTLKLDGAKLQKIIDDPTKDIATLFAALGKPSDSLITFIGSTDSTQAGSYAINITRLATQGTAAGDVVLGATTTISAGTNDTLSAKVDGVSATVTLAAGNYTPAQMAAEVQSKLNGAAAFAGASIAVTVSLSSGKLALASNRYGSGSTVEAIAGNAAGGIFGTVDYTNATGLDAAGSIGDVAATGSGQTLTGAGAASGLSLRVTGGATGNRGAIHFSQGYAYQLDRVAAGFLGAGGALGGRTDGIERSIRDIEAERERIARRLDAVEQRYRAQFTALDTMMSSMTRTSNFLAQQLANLPKINQ